MPTEQDRKQQTDKATHTPEGTHDMTEEGLGGDQGEREDGREERGREHDIARRQMPIQR